MTMMRVIPRVADLNLEAFRSANRNPERKVDTRMRDHDETVESKRSSIEIVSLTCDGFGSNDEKEVGRKDVSVETEITELPGDSHSSLTQRKNSPVIIPNDPELSMTLSRSDKDPREVTWEVLHVESLSKDRTERGCNSVDQKQDHGDRTAEPEKERCNSWWKDSRQTILQFFAKILSKRGGMGARGMTDRVLPASRRHGVERVSRSNKKQNEREGRRDADGGGIYLKTVGNGYIANRAKTNRRECVTEDKSREEEHRPSILVRQIQRTRDKNLRVMLLERELRARLPKRDIAALTANSTVNLRQLSSPLC